LPALSAATLAGWHKLSGPTPLTSPLVVPRLHPVVVKLPLWPNTKSALVSPASASPLLGLSGVLYSSTRPLP